jgi:four helix bundle protein
MTEGVVKQEFKNRVYKFSVEIIRFVNEASNEKRVFYSLIDQLIRSSTSIGANIIEAKSSSSKREFIRYFEIALKSANETKYWLCLFRDALNTNHETTAVLLEEANAISKIIASSILTMKGKK